MSPDRYHTGAINCELKCPIPDGVRLCEMPPARHAWADMVFCPNDDCGRNFLVVDRGEP